MEWHLWSGFTGEGVYAIINKESLTSIDLPYGSSTPGTVTQDLLVHTETAI